MNEFSVVLGVWAQIKLCKVKHIMFCPVPLSPLGVIKGILWKVVENHPVLLAVLGASLLLHVNRSSVLAPKT